MKTRRLSTSQAIGAFVVSREARNCSPKTITWYQSMLAPLAAAHPSLPTEAWHLDEMLAALRKRITVRNRTPSPATYADNHRALKIFFRWLRKHHKWTGLYEDLETPHQRRKLPKALTDDQVDRVLAANRHHQRDLVLLLTFLDTGIRLSELAGLDKLDILTGAGGSHLHVNGKTGERLVPISDATVQLIARLPYHDHWLWTSATHPGQRLTASGVQQAVERAFIRAGLRGRPHVLRHTFGTLYIRHGGSVLVLQQIMGHSNIKTTQIYIELAAQHMRDEHTRYSPVSRRLRLVADNEAQAAGAAS